MPFPLPQGLFFTPQLADSKTHTETFFLAFPFPWGHESNLYRCVGNASLQDIINRASIDHELVGSSAVAAKRAAWWLITANLSTFLMQVGFASWKA